VLVRVQQDAALAIGQLSHAWLSGQLARAWGNALFPAPEPREAIALGAEQHDIGWAIFDLEPGFNAESGLPRAFLEIALEDHLRIWGNAPDMLLSQSVHAALVVSLHGRSISELRARAAADDPRLQAHIARERTRQADLSARLGLSEEQVRRIQRQMWTWDGLSLALCNGWQPFVARDVPTRDGLAELELRDVGDGRFVLDPWPFTEEHVEVRCEGRQLVGRYDSEAAMRQAFAQAELVTLTFALAPA
jgi:Protein of unknown function (DUF3891)